MAHVTIAVVQTVWTTEIRHHDGQMVHVKLDLSKMHAAGLSEVLLYGLRQIFADMARGTDVSFEVHQDLVTAKAARLMKGEVRTYGARDALLTELISQVHAAIRRHGTPAQMALWKAHKKTCKDAETLWGFAKDAPLILTTRNIATVKKNAAKIMQVKEAVRQSNLTIELE